MKENDIFNEMMSWPESKRLNFIASLYPKINGLYCVKRMLQLYNHNGSPGKGGNIDYHKYINDKDLYIERKTDNGTNSLKSFIESGQFEKDYRRLVDENFTRKNMIVFVMFKNDNMTYNDDDFIIHGIYMKKNVKDKTGDWTHRYDGKTLREFYFFLETGLFKDLKIENCKYLYGQSKWYKDLGIRLHKIFQKRDDGTYISRSNEFNDFDYINSHLKDDKVTLMNLNELYFDIWKLTYNSLYKDKNREWNFYVLIQIDNIMHKIDYNFTYEDFENKKVFVNKFIKIINEKLTNKVKRRFIV